jgi:hypothetical protein
MSRNGANLSLFGGFGGSTEIGHGRGNDPENYRRLFIKCYAM